MNTSNCQNQHHSGSNQGTAGFNQSLLAFSPKRFITKNQQQVIVEMKEPNSDMLEIEAAFNARHSNSEGLPEIDRDQEDPLVKMSAKDKEHFTFLKTLKKRLNVDPSKLIDLECRMSGVEKDTISQQLALSDDHRNSKIANQHRVANNYGRFPINQSRESNLLSIHQTGINGSAKYYNNSEQELPSKTMNNTTADQQSHHNQNSNNLSASNLSILQQQKDLNSRGTHQGSGDHFQNEDSYSRISINSNSNQQSLNNTNRNKKRKSAQPQKIQSKIVHACQTNISPKQPEGSSSKPDISSLEPNNLKRFKSTADGQPYGLLNTPHSLQRSESMHLQTSPASGIDGPNKQITDFFPLNEHSSTLMTNSLQPGIDAKMMAELEKLRKDLETRENQLRQKENEVDRSQQLLKSFANQVQDMQNHIEIQEASKKLFIESHIKTLSLLEDKQRKEKRIWLNEQAIRLGRLTTQRQGPRFVEVWEEGEAFKKSHKKLQEISAEKGEIERLKKNRSNNKKCAKKSGNLPAVPIDGFSGGLRGLNNSNQTGLLALNENSEFDLEESEFNNIDKNEQKEIYQFKQRMLENEEKRVREELQLLDKEKCTYLNEFKRMRDEESSKYAGIHSKKKYSVLANKYLILSLLGKGGYSEVYKGYDLENCREVACKIHQFDDTWNETIKESYIKHALRENEIHKDLNNRRVVKQFDTVEMDHNSFCTVLELCSGPDLYFYLKQNKQIPEKEAKLIISQILSGLKYLNEQKQKIIHYDLKPQNILFHNGEVKLTDFGLCKIMEENTERIELTSQGVGTYWYQAPECFEMSNNPPMINSKVDIWSIGVIYFEILFGQKPFGHDKSQQAILQDQTILNAREVIFPAKPQISDGCKDFIRKCLAYYQHDRYDVYEAYFSPYLRGGSSSGTGSNNNSSSNPPLNSSSSCNNSNNSFSSLKRQ